MSKKYKVLLVLLIIVVVFILVMGIVGGIRFYNLRKIIKANNEKAELNNYTMRTVIKSSGSASNITVYYRDGVGKIVSTNGAYTWSNGQEAYYIDESTETAYILDVNNATNLAGYDMFMSMIPGYKGIFSSIKVALNIKNEFKSQMIDGKEYIVITTFENEVKKTIWINDDTKTIAKAQIEFSGGTKIDYEYSLEFGKVSNINIAKPALSSYTIKKDLSGFQSDISQDLITYITGEKVNEEAEVSNGVEVNNTNEAELNTVVNE